MPPKSKTYDEDLTKPKEYHKNSWFYQKDRYFNRFEWFWIIIPLQYVFGTIYNPKTQVHEWRPAYYYRKKEFFYSMFWFLVDLSVLVFIAWLFNFYSAMRLACYLTWQNMFGESVQIDRCVNANVTDYLAEYFHPNEMISRNNFNTLTKLSPTEALQGYAENVYYQPVGTESTITFQIMMSDMKRWIKEKQYENKCVCFFQFGVGLRGGFSKGSFFISPVFEKKSDEYVNVKIGGKVLTVPERAAVISIDDTSCSIVESKPDTDTIACLSFCNL